MNENNLPNVHTSVLLNETVAGLNLHKGLIVVDATLGGSGHSKEIVKYLGKSGVLIGLDADSYAIKLAEQNLSGFEGRLEIVNKNFGYLSEVLEDLNIKKVDRFLFDLGLSSNQLSFSNRGFSFQVDEPLMMTFGLENDEEKITAYDVINRWQEENIADIIYGFGGEQFSRGIAKAIVEKRKEKPIETTFELIEAIEKGVPGFYKKKKLHFATKTFQAIRMAVNNETGMLQEGLKAAWGHLSEGGRIAVISFHEVEDRIVKRFFKLLKETKQAHLINKKPIVPSKNEILENPRSRSAKLRIIEKI